MSKPSEEELVTIADQLLKQLEDDYALTNSYNPPNDPPNEHPQPPPEEEE